MKQNDILYPLNFEQNLHKTVWGSEDWEVSAVPMSETVVANGPLAGKTLGELTRAFGAALLGNHIAETYGDAFPLLVKFIDAHGDLSIQVHPNDELAMARHGSMGKTEMWYVTEAEPGATLLAGFREQISKEDYARRVEDGSIVEALARHEVHKGDVFFIPSGRVHAICSGIRLCEIQQSSDITYRLYDYHRVGLDGKPRQLHTEEALDAIDFHVYDDYRTHYTSVEEGAVTIADCTYFTVNEVTTQQHLHRDLSAADSFVTLSCLEGSCRITTSKEHTLELTCGHSCLLPACDNDFDIEGKTKLLEAIAKNPHSIDRHT